MSQDGHSTQIQRCIDRLRTGDPSARDELLTCVSERLTRLTRRMLRDFPGVHRWEQTDDVLQNALMRLCRALGEAQPPTVADFFRLAAAQIRRELIDLARRYSGARGLGANLAGSDRAEQAAAANPNPPDTTRDPDRLAIWTDFHLAAEALAEEEREVFDLLFYQGLSQAEAAAVLGVSEVTIKRRWRAARMQLVQSLGGMLPQACELVDDHPDLTQYRSCLAWSHNNIGAVLSDTGRPAEAMESHRQALGVFQRLAHDNPTIDEFQRDLAVSHSLKQDIAAGWNDAQHISRDPALALSGASRDRSPF